MVQTASSCTCNNTLPKFKLVSSLKLISAAHAVDRKLEVAWLMMPHGMSSMSMVKNPTKGFDGIIDHVKGSGDMLALPRVWWGCPPGPFWCDDLGAVNSTEYPADPKNWTTLRQCPSSPPWSMWTYLSNTVIGKPSLTNQQLRKPRGVLWRWLDMVCPAGMAINVWTGVPFCPCRIITHVVVG